jgi:cytochrome oxidase Cu insertion factor (SCO1/SenC/PrrC family)
MNFKRLLLLLAVATLLVSGTHAVAAVPAGSSAGQLPDIKVWDEADIQSTLWTKLKASGSGPVLVLPLYTRCTMSCPVLARRLVKETAQMSGAAPYRVLIFSFDPGDDGPALRQFRAQEKLPSSWLLVRSNAADIRRFCDIFHYSILNEGSVMIHANQIFLLSHDLQWRATFIDESWNAGDLRTWMARVESPGILGWFAMNPEKLAFAGFGGMSISLALIMWALLSRSRVP